MVRSKAKFCTTKQSVFQYQSPVKRAVIEFWSVFFSRISSAKAKRALFSVSCARPFWTNELKKGPTSQKADSRVLHEEYPLGKPFGISEEAKDDRGHGNVAIAGRVETGKDDGSYKISFSQLGRPRAYEGKTSLTIRPRDRRVLVLPAIDLGEGELLETVVVLVYQSEASEDGERSRFEGE